MSKVIMTLGTKAVLAMISLVVCTAMALSQTSSQKRPLPYRIVCTNPLTTFVAFVEPIYPKLAIKNRIQGTVVLELLVSRDGIPSEVTTKKGNPVLADAAIAAAKQWRYKPILLNDSPVETRTQVTIKFILPKKQRGPVTQPAIDTTKQ